MCPIGNQSQERAPGEFNLVPSGPKQRAERKKVPALAQARTVDLILVTELTRWSRSTRFAARALTCFKFRFVSSPLDAPGYAWFPGQSIDQAARLTLAGL